MGPPTNVDGENGRHVGILWGSVSFNGAADKRRRRVAVGAIAPSAIAGFNGAADKRRRRGVSSSTVTLTFRQLQWGRRQTSTERPRIGAAWSGVPVGFNGAADKRRRRDSKGIKVRAWQRSLQWGRRQTSTESGSDCRSACLRPLASMGPPTNVDGERAAARCVDALDIASMGPPTNVDGETRARRSSRVGAWGFNGAADKRRRRGTESMADRRS